MRVLVKKLINVLIILVTLSGPPAFSVESGFSEKSFSNGARLVYKRLPEAKTVTARIVLPVGFLHEPQEYLEISHLVEHLIFRGNNEYSLSDSPDLMDEEGNFYNAFTTLNRTEYILQSTSENLSSAFSFFLDLILHPAFSLSDLEKEKKIVTVEKALRNTPGNIFLTYLNRLTQNQLDSKIQAIGRAQVQAFHSEYYTTDRITVIITGNFNVSEITGYLSSLPKPETKQPKRALLRPTIPLEEDIILEDYLPGEKYRLLFGVNLKELSEKDLAIAKVLPYILLYESRQYDYVTNRPLDYENYLFSLGDDFYLIFEYRDFKEEYTPKMSKWHERNIQRYHKYLQTKNFSEFLKILSTNLSKNLKLIETSPTALNDYYSQLLFEPTIISKRDLKIIKGLSSKDLRKFVKNHLDLEKENYHKIVIKAY